MFQPVPPDEVRVEVHVDFGIPGRALEIRRTLDAPRQFIELIAPFDCPLKTKQRIL